jgi:hypothetical protein
VNLVIEDYLIPAQRFLIRPVLGKKVDMSLESQGKTSFFPRVLHQPVLTTFPGHVDESINVKPYTLFTQSSPVLKPNSFFFFFFLILFFCVIYKKNEKITL